MVIDIKEESFRRILYRCDRIIEMLHAEFHGANSKMRGGRMARLQLIQYYMDDTADELEAYCQNYSL